MKRNHVQISPAAIGIAVSDGRTGIVAVCAGANFTYSVPALATEIPIAVMRIRRTSLLQRRSHSFLQSGEAQGHRYCYRAVCGKSPSRQRRHKVKAAMTGSDDSGREPSVLTKGVTQTPEAFGSVFVFLHGLDRQRGGDPAYPKWI